MTDPVSIRVLEDAKKALEEHKRIRSIEVRKWLLRIGGDVRTKILESHFNPPLKKLL